MTHEGIAADLERRIGVILHSDTVPPARRGALIEQAVADARQRHAELMKAQRVASVFT